MYNETLWIILLLVNFSMVLFFFYFFGKKGLFLWTAISIILANIQVIMFVNLFGIVVTLGNITYGSTFLVTDVLNELYDKKEAKKSVLIGFMSLLSMALIMNICIQFIPDESDFAAEALSTIFGFMPRIAIASVVAYFVSQLHDVWIYDFWKRKTKAKYSLIVVRNNLSTLVSQIIDSLIFCTIAFYGIERSIFVQIVISTVIMKWIVAFADTPFIYIAVWMKNKKIVKDY